MLGENVKWGFKMFVLHRVSRGIGTIFILGVFDTYEGADKFQKRCKLLHHHTHYDYEITNARKNP